MIARCLPRRKYIDSDSGPPSLAACRNKLRRRQLTDDLNVEITGRDMREGQPPQMSVLTWSHPERGIRAWRFRPEFVDGLGSRIALVDLIGRHVQLTPKGADEYAGRCPFHQDENSSFYVVENKRFFLLRVRRAWQCGRLC
jgi:hypothetical protein